MLKKLSLQNFKSFSNLEIEFPQGLTLLTGPNFSGKSSVLHGVLYALWGPLGVPGGKEVAVKRGESSAEVDLEFSLSGHEYRVHRKGSSASLYEDGDCIAKSASAVTSSIEDLLGFDRKRFLQLKYGEQKKIENLLTLGAGELHSIIEDVAQATVINEVIEKTKVVANECRGGVEALSDIDTDSIQEELNTLTVDLQARHTELEQINASVNAAQEQYNAVQEQTAVASQQEEERVKLRKQLAQIESNLPALESRKAVADSTVNALYGTEAMLDQLRMGLSTLVPQAQQAAEQVQRLNALRRDADLLVKRVGDSDQLIEKTLTSLETMGVRADPSTLELVLEQAKEERTRIQERHAQVTSAIASGICPACQRPYDEDQDLGSYYAEQGELASKISELNREIPSAEGQLRVAREHNAELDRLNKVLIDTQEIVKDQRTKMELTVLEKEELEKLNPEEALTALTGQSETLNEQVQELTDKVRQLAEATALSEQIGEQITQLTHLKRQIGTLPEPIDMRPLLDQVNTLKEVLDQATVIHSEKHSAYTQLYGQWTALNESLQRAAKTIEKRKSLQKRLATADNLGKFLRTNRDRFMGDIWSGVLSYASSFSSDCTGGKIERLMRTDGGAFRFVEEGEEAPIDAASGAQRSIMGLGVQLALAQMLPSQFPTLMLDEPTADADPERSLAMASLLSADNHQLIMSSHRELDGMIAQQVINLGEEG
mgnify:CR=1 FL=1